MGQHASTQQVESPAPAEQPMSQLGAVGSTQDDLECLDESRHTASELQRTRGQDRHQWSVRRRISRRVRTDMSQRSLDADEPMASLPTTFESSASQEPAERTPTPFDTGDIMLYNSTSPGPHRPASASSSISSIIRRGRRLINRRRPMSAAADEPQLDRRRSVGRPLSNRLSAIIGSPSAPRSSRNRLSALFSGPPENSRFLHRRRNFASISEPLPAESDGWAWDDRSSVHSTRIDLLEDASAESGSAGLNGGTAAVPRRSRLSRVRDSLLPPVPPFFHHLSTRHQPPPESRSSTTPPPRLTYTGADSFLPRIPTPTIGLDLGQPPLPAPSDVRQAAPPPPAFDHRAPADRSLRGTHTERQSRRAANGTRQDAARARRGIEDQATSLSLHLSVAATAIAASLVGNAERAFAEAHDVASDGVDGSFDSFLRALRSGSLASALRGGMGGSNGSGDDAGTDAADGTLSPINFFRIFRFGSTSDQGRNGSDGSASSPSDAQANGASGFGSSDENGARMVPVIIVGIRSVTPRESLGLDDGGNGINSTSPLFDALSNMPLMMPPAHSNRSSGALLRRTDRRSRFSRSRRASMTAVNPFPANYDSQRHQRMNASLDRPQSELSPAGAAAAPAALSESPPGPNPPPSTPAEHALSSVSSGNNTPSRRPSSASGAPASVSAEFNARPSGANAGASAPEAGPSQPSVRRRRLSDGEFARYRDLGPGSSRRNGIVGDRDSEIDTNSPAYNGGNTSSSAGNSGGSGAGNGSGSGSGETAGRSEGSRTWIVYVLGGSYPEDHPILTTPSLFTDSPTYEDMLLLSSIIGPAKPPVASRDDVASAPGVYRITSNADRTFVARASASGEELLFDSADRCLICLCDYQLLEEVRQLGQCRHIFHRECIDEWLVTGRNSCPLCRGQGVSEKAAASTAAADPPSSQAQQSPHTQRQPQEGRA